MQAQTYEKLWKQVEQAQQKSLPQTVVKLTEEICRKALDEKNSPQLLKAYLCRAAFQERLMPDSLYARLNEMERWVTTETDEAERAILHSLLASEYAEPISANGHPDNSWKRWKHTLQPQLAKWLCSPKPRQTPTGLLWSRANRVPTTATTSITC